MPDYIVPEMFSHYRDDWHFTPVVDTGSLVFLSGVTAAHPGRDISENPETQFHDAFAKLKIYLNEADLGFENIVELTSFHVDLKRHMETFSAVKDVYIKPPFPAWTAIGVADFIPKNALVEMRIVACR
ncbi:MAG: Rid family hydrolase [Hyphomicrobiales bacterium]